MADLIRTPKRVARRPEYADVRLLVGSKNGSRISHHVNEPGFGKGNAEGPNVEFIQGRFVYPVRCGCFSPMAASRPMHRHDEGKVRLKRRVTVEDRTGVIKQE